MSVVILCSIFLLPLMLQRTVAARHPRFAFTLLLPCGLTGIAYLRSLGDPFGVFGATAHTQVEFSALTQFSRQNNIKFSDD